MKKTYSLTLLNSNVSKGEFSYNGSANQWWLNTLCGQFFWAEEAFGMIDEISLMDQNPTV